MNIATRKNIKVFLLNLGVVGTLYLLAVTLLNLLFVVIDNAYPQIINEFNYTNSQFINFPVGMIIISFVFFVFFTLRLQKELFFNEDYKNINISKYFKYIIVFFAGIILLVTFIEVVTYFFIDGQDLMLGFSLKIFAMFLIIFLIFLYYFLNMRREFKSFSRITWLVFVSFFIVGSIVWSYWVLGSPRLQQLMIYDEQKVSDLIDINNEIINYYTKTGILPNNLENISTKNYAVKNDNQTGKPYQYEKTGDKTYNLCAYFNKGLIDTDYETKPMAYGGDTWVHPPGRYCFAQVVI